MKALIFMVCFTVLFSILFDYTFKEMDNNSIILKKSWWAWYCNFIISAIDEKCFLTSLSRANYFFLEFLKYDASAESAEKNILYQFILSTEFCKTSFILCVKQCINKVCLYVTISCNLPSSLYHHRFGPPSFPHAVTPMRE